MDIDFFKDEEVVSEKLFGICDDGDDAVKSPAYVDKDPAKIDNWIAKVSNEFAKAVCFIAVDNKIEIRRENGRWKTAVTQCFITKTTLFS